VGDRDVIHKSTGTHALTRLATTHKLSRRAEKDRAFAAKQAADELINFMQYDLSDTLGKLGRLAICSGLRAIFLARLRATATALPSLRSLPSRTSAMHSGNWI
jgi:hypothetical protein